MNNGIQGKWMHKRDNGIKVILTFQKNNELNYEIFRGEHDITDEVFRLKKEYRKVTYKYDENTKPKNLDYIVHNLADSTQKKMFGIMKLISKDSIEIKTSIFPTRPTFFDPNNAEIFIRIE
ncbi:hypothetical protein JBL43_16025 [Aureibaculum sp. A20]|uniref:Uncharacterized protein n=2 Tax=Aureibaculum flavum TaxID=2795986 RepID=A0ABS0WUW6_9FLAO|nr:hypothetical protein [Aureibaculum flavum]